MPVNNEIYKSLGHTWWDEEESGMLSSLRFLLHPVRFSYFRRIVEQKRETGQILERVLDVGCGGGFLAEEFAKIGSEVIGIDPAAESIESARRHAAEGGLMIDYLTGVGESLPFRDGTFDIVLCCDVLEHIDNIEQVLGEISRVLKTGGILFYDTINRTLTSKIALIKIIQEWRSTAFMEPNVHVWSSFIKPRELVAALSQNGLMNRETRGISPHKNLLAHWINLHRLVKGKITYRELGKRMGFHEGRDTTANYMGYATKEPATNLSEVV